MPGLGVTELIIILVIVIVLFGRGRIGQIGGEIGQAIGNFRKGIQSTTEDDEKAKVEEA